MTFWDVGHFVGWFFSVTKNKSFLNQSCPPLTNFDNQLKKGDTTTTGIAYRNFYMNATAPTATSQTSTKDQIHVDTFNVSSVCYFYLGVSIKVVMFFFKYTDRDTVCVVQMLPLFNTTGWLLGWFGVHLQQVGQPGCNIVHNLSAHFRWFWSHPPPESTWCAKRHLCMSHGPWAPMIGASLTRRILKLGVKKIYKIYLQQPNK